MITYQSKMMISVTKQLSVLLVVAVLLKYISFANARQII